MSGATQTHKTKQLLEEHDPRNNVEERSQHLVLVQQENELHEANEGEERASATASTKQSPNKFSQTHLNAQKVSGATQTHKTE